MLVGDGLGEGPRRTGTARARRTTRCRPTSRRCRPRRASGLEVGHEPRLADARPRPRRRSVDAPAGSRGRRGPRAGRRRSASRPTNRPDRAAATAGTPASPSSRADPDRPGLAAEQLLAQRPRRRAPSAPRGRVASSRRISPGWAIALDPRRGRDGRARSATSRARRARRAGPRRPRRSPSRSGPGAPRPAGSSRWARRLADREGAVGRPAGRRRRGPCGQPKTAKTASPMNFSRVPSKRLDRVDHRDERRVDPPPDLLGIVLGDEPDVVDEIGEQRGDDPPIAPLAGRTGRPRPRWAAAGRVDRSPDSGGGHGDGSDAVASRTGRRTGPPRRRPRHMRDSAPAASSLFPRRGPRASSTPASLVAPCCQLIESSGC